jgi:YHS domain-containing protein
MTLTRFLSHALLSGLLVGAPAFAQEGSRTEPELALGGHDPVSLSQGKKVKGEERHKLNHEGYTYLFSSRRNLAEFQSDSEKLAIQDHGYCPVAKVMMNRNVKGEPEIFSVHEGRIYLLANEEAKRMFDAEPARFIETTQPRPLPREGS